MASSAKDSLPDSVSENGERTVDAEGSSRRDVLRGLAAAAAGAIAGGVLSTEKAEAAHGTLNAVSNDGNPAIHGENTSGFAFGNGVEGTSTGGTGVIGRGVNGVAGVSDSFGVGVRGTSDSGEGVNGHSTTGTGVFGSSRDSIGVDGTGTTGVRGTSTAGFGVRGNSDAGTAVRGDSLSGTGVEGTSLDGSGVIGDSRNDVGVTGGSLAGIGVRGVAFSIDGVGVQAEGSLALDVRGGAKFSTAGSGIIPATQDSAFVSAPFVTAVSHVTVTLTGDPGQPTTRPGKPVVVWVERQPGTGFVAHLSLAPRVNTPFTFLVVEPT